MKCKTNFVAVLVAWSAVATVTAQSLDNGLIGYWPFDESSGSIAHEASGRGYDGVLRNYAGNQGNWLPGQIGGALDFGGLGPRHYVQVPDFVKPTTSLTISAWAWADSLPQWATIAANWNGLYGTLNYGLFGSEGNLSLYFAEPNPQGINVANGSEWAPALSLGVWHHVAVVVDGGRHRVTFYRDGSETGTFFFGGSFYPAPVPYLNIGGEPTYDYPFQGFWDGKLDDLGIWTRPLTSGEIRAIYSAGLSGQSILALVPEPGGAALFLVGGLAFLGRRRRN